MSTNENSKSEAMAYYVAIKIDEATKTPQIILGLIIEDATYEKPITVNQVDSLIEKLTEAKKNLTEASFWHTAGGN